MNFKRIFSIFLTVCLLLSMLSAIAFAAEETTETATETPAEDATVAEKNETGDLVVDASGMTGDGTTGNPADLASFTLVSENNNLAFYLNDITGFFAVVNKKTNAIWYSNPLDWEKDQIAKSSNQDQLHSQIVVTYLNSSYDTITIASNAAHIVSEHAGNKQILTYVFSGASRNFSIPVSYELKEDYLDIKLMVEDIAENSDARITQITLLPFMGAAGLNDSGYALIPDGSGSLMTFNKTCKNLSQYTGYIYNRDITASSNNATYVDLNETISLPVYGINKNGAGYLAVITEGAGTAAIKASVSKLFNSYNSISSHIILRDTQTRKNSTGTAGEGLYYSEVKSGNLSLRVYPLDADKSTYVGMAEKYREYLIAEQGLTKLDSSNSISNALNIDLFCAAKAPMHFLGIPYTGIKELTTFSEVKDIIADLKGKNIENMVITLSGWNKGGLETTATTKFNPESKLGGVKAAKDLISYANEQGATLVFDNDIQTFYSATSNIKKFKHTAFSLSSTPVTIFPFSKSLNSTVNSGKFHHVIHPEYMLQFTEKFVDDALENGVTNFSFKSAGTDPYAAYNKNSILTRDKSADIMSNLFAKVSEKATEGIVSTKVGNSFVLGNVDNIVEVPVYSSYLIMSQTSVPFYQIVLRGYVNMAPEALNLSSEVTELELKCAESGLSLFYQLMDAESTELLDTSFADYYACSYDDYFQIMTDTYSRMQSVYDAVDNSAINGHEINGEVRITSFVNGAKVYVNYGTTDATINGVNVPARDYVAVGGGK